MKLKLLTLSAFVATVICAETTVLSADVQALFDLAKSVDALADKMDAFRAEINTHLHNSVTLIELRMRDERGRTMAHYLAEAGDMGSLLSFLNKFSPAERPALLNAADAQGKTPFQLAQDSNRFHPDDLAELKDMAAESASKARRKK